MTEGALPPAVAEHVALLELVERDDTALLYEDRSLDCLGWLKTNARTRHEALQVIWRKRKIPGLRELDRAVEQRLKQAAEEVKQSAADEPPPDGAVVIQLGKPLEAARTFISTCHPTLMHHNGDWLAYRGGRYVEIEPLIVDHELSGFLENAVTRVATPSGFTYVPVNPDPSLISTIARMVQIQVVRERGAFAPPCWLDPQPDDPPPGEILACANGLLHLPSGRLLDPDPRFFTTSALPFDYDPDAPEPKRWLQALEEWWPDSPESHSCLQEIFGYLLVPDTSLQKIFMLIGRSRGGKGTIIRVLVYLLGSLNHASPTMEQLAGRFGMQSMIGKQLAVMTDLYLHKRGGGSRAVENLLRISGEDDVNVERKNKTDWIGRLPTRFLLAATVAPILPDMSGAWPTVTCRC